MIQKNFVQRHFPAHILTQFGIGICISLSSLFVSTIPALAAPASVFEPILDEITETLPDGWVMRLPASVPTEAELYPFIDPVFVDNGRFGLRVGTEPNCYEGDCFGLIFFVSLPTASWPPTGDTFTAVDLGNGIQGYRQSSQGQARIEWMQDDQYYMLIHNFDIVSAEDGIAMAQSMVSEPPIRAQ